MGLKKLGALILVCVVAFCAPDPYEGNPFYVDPATVRKENLKWTMNLKNHHATSQGHNRVATANNPEILLAAATFEGLDKRVLRFKMTDATAPRWEVPIYYTDSGKTYEKIPISEMGVKYVEDPFGFEVTDPKTGEIVISTLKWTNSSLKFYDKYVEYGVWFPSKRVFGMGERVTPQFELCPTRDFCVYTTYNRDEVSPLDNGEPPGGKQDYGQHPFYMIQLKSGLFIGMLFLNSNAQDAVLVKAAQDSINVYHKTIGGIIDSYIFYPESADGVLQRYHSLIGKPYVPPFWSLGFH